MHYLSSDGQPGLHLLSRRGHHCAEDGERAYAAAPIKTLAFSPPSDRSHTSRDLAASSRMYLAKRQVNVPSMG